MLRAWPVPLAVAALLAAPASAAEEVTVAATPANTFEPREARIHVGDTVRWANQAGFHNVKFDDGSFEEPAAPSPSLWTASRTFERAGTYRYYCEAHGGPNGSGMAGTVLVAPHSAEHPGPPGLAFTTKRRQSLERVLAGVVLNARCTGGCTASFTVLDRGRPIGGRSTQLEPERERVEVELRKKARKRLAKRRKPFKLVVEAHAVSAGGDHTLQRTITVEP